MELLNEEKRYKKLDDIITDNIIVEMQNRIQVYFTEESGLHDINVKAETVDKIVVDGGFLCIHDSYDDGWHCYNLKYVKHFHHPDKRRKKK